MFVLSVAPVKLCSYNCMLLTNLVRRVNDISNIRRSRIRFDLYVDSMHIFFTACHGIEIDRDRLREKKVIETKPRELVLKHQSSGDRNGKAPATMLCEQLLIVHCTVKYDVYFKRRIAKISISRNKLIIDQC